MSWLPDEYPAPPFEYLPKNGDQLIELCGAGKSSHALPFATSMNFFQISAGNVPPATEMPCTLCISRSASGYPTQTADAR